MSANGQARLFVAVDLPSDVRERLAGWARTAMGVGGPRLIEASAIHLTLVFVGYRPQGVINDIAGLALGCAMPVGDLELGAPLWLPPRRPRVLAVEVRDADGTLEELQAAVSDALVAGAGYEAEKRRFRPHVTVARMGARAPAPASRELAPTPALRFAPEALTLYRSRLARAGASYEPLARVRLS
jgi:2'-5' RNA ligase